MVAKRFDGLKIERQSDEVLALKPGAAQAYALNQTAAIVFDLCDGEHSKLEIAKAIQHRTGLPADERVVDLALDGLVDAGLVALDGSAPRPSITRRALVRRLSVSAATMALLPVIQPILATPSAAVSSPHPTGGHFVGSFVKGTGFHGGGPPPGHTTGPPPGHGGGNP